MKHEIKDSGITESARRSPIIWLSRNRRYESSSRLARSSLTRSSLRPCRPWSDAVTRMGQSAAWPRLGGIGSHVEFESATGDIPGKDPYHTRTSRRRVEPASVMASARTSAEVVIQLSKRHTMSGRHKTAFIT